MSEIDAAILQWRKVAQQERERVALGLTYGCDHVALHNAELYEDTARSLEIERDTGVAVCNSCFKPLNATRDRRGYHSCVG
jgi:hypothetical protein